VTRKPSSWRFTEGDGGVEQLQVRLSMASAHLAMPKSPVGWVAVAAGRQADRSEALQAARALNRLGLGTVTADFSDRAGDVGAIAHGLTQASEWLAASPISLGLPVGLAGAGLGGTAAVLAAQSAGKDTPALIVWDGCLERIDEPLSPLSFPTLLLLDRNRPWRERRPARQLAGELGARAEYMLARSLDRNAEQIVREWYEQAISELPARQHRVSGHAVRRAAVGLVAAAAIAAPAAAAATTHGKAAPQSRFASGRVVSKVVGDGFSLARLERVAPANKPGKKVPVQGDGFSALVHPVHALTDAHGLKYFINTAITFATSSSASGAASEASFTHPVVASTSGGGTTASTLNDAFDGYNTLALSLNNTVAQPQTGNANFTFYNQDGAATTECLGAISGVNRQVVFPAQTIGNFTVQRKVYVPDNASYARWLNYVTNTSGSPQTVTLDFANNLGSDSNTRITGSSSGDNAAQTSDTWVATFQNYSGTTSSDVRLGHVLQGTGAPAGLAGLNFADSDDNPWWGYTLTLQPGQTRIIADYVVGEASKAAAAAAAAALATSPAEGCMTNAEILQIANFLIDTTPPVTTTALTSAAPDGDNGWYVQPVLVQVSATDNFSGVKETRCQLDGTAPANFDAMAPGCAYTGAGANVSTDGPHNVYAASEDNALNKETVKTTSFKIDQTKPNIVFDHQSPKAKKGWNTGDVTLFWNCSDPGPNASGVVSATVQVTETGEGKGLQVKGTCRDLAGNKKSDIRTVNISRTDDLAALAPGLHADSAHYHAVLDRIKVITADIKAGNNGKACADLAELTSFLHAHGSTFSQQGLNALLAAIAHHQALLSC
jgi:hypothetical protein